MEETEAAYSAARAAGLGRPVGARATAGAGSAMVVDERLHLGLFCFSLGRALLSEMEVTRWF
jgi:hypothetical protein